MQGALTLQVLVVVGDLAAGVDGELGAIPRDVEVGLDGHVCG